MPTNIVRGSSLEFVADLFDSAGDPVTPPVGIYMRIAYTDTAGSTQAASFELIEIDGNYVGSWTVPSDVASKTMPTMSLCLTSSGAYPVAPPDPLLRIWE